MIVYAGPFHGIERFKINNTAKDIGFPASTGRNHKLGKVSEKTLRERSKGVVWEQRIGNSHPDVHPGRFGKIDGKFLNEMKELGWKQDGIDNRSTFIPVLIKISNPELKRFE